MTAARGNLIYDNPLAEHRDIGGFVLEGEAKIDFEDGAMQMRNALDPSQGQKSNFVYWCPEDFPDRIEITWEFKPLTGRGLAILFFAASAQDGGSIFSDSLAPRDGRYELYHSGDINCLHVSYFRRMWEDERSFHTCNLRKSRGFHLVAQGADPLPDVSDSKGFYQMCLRKDGPEAAFSIEGLPIFSWLDNGNDFGSVLYGGKIGFRQMAPLSAAYRNLRVYELNDKR